MPLESVTHLSDLNQSNPPGTDPKNQGDDHLRNIKLALRTDLPNINAPVNCTPAQLNLLNSLTALSVLANATNGAAAPAALAAATDGLILRRNGTVLQFGVADSNGGGFHKAYVLNDQVFSSTVVANVTDMQNVLTMDADTIYEVEVTFFYLPSSGGGFKANLAISQTPQFSRGEVINADQGLKPVYYTSDLTDATKFNSAGAGGGVPLTITMHGIIHTHATLTSTLSVQAGLFAAAGNVTLQRGSPIRVYKYGVA